jgi:hypothetical protein
MIKLKNNLMKIYYILKLVLSRTFNPYSILGFASTTSSLTGLAVPFMASNMSHPMDSPNSTQSPNVYRYEPQPSIVRTIERPKIQEIHSRILSQTSIDRMEIDNYHLYQNETLSEGTLRRMRERISKVGEFLHESTKFPFIKEVNGDIHSGYGKFNLDLNFRYDTCLKNCRESSGMYIDKNREHNFKLISSPLVDDKFKKSILDKDLSDSYSNKAMKFHKECNRECENSKPITDSTIRLIKDVPSKIINCGKEGYGFFQKITKKELLSFNRTKEFFSKRWSSFTLLNRK